MPQEQERYCVICKRPVAKRSKRDLCKGHKHMADSIDKDIERRMDDEHYGPPTPRNVPVYREPEPDGDGDGA